VPINNFAERSLGFAKALSLAGIACNKNDIIQLSPSIKHSYTGMLQELSKRDNLPTAFFCDNDIIAFGAMKALAEVGKRLPEDVSVIGFDDMPDCKLITPNLSTVRVFRNQMVIIAVKRIMERIRGESDEPVKIEVGTRLVLRESVAKTDDKGSDIQYD
jgi:DNA-binding LacI/PurR family transcriptional regulator